MLARRVCREKWEHNREIPDSEASAVAMSQLETLSHGEEVEAALRDFWLAERSRGSIDEWAGQSDRLGNTQ